MEAIRILVVEDDPDINQLLCTIMSDASYQCQPAFSGSEAMLWAERERFDLVLLDLMLPGLTGEEFITRIRRGRTMPIIVLSAKAGLEDKVNVLRLGADDFIPKPFDNLEVLAGWRPSCAGCRSFPRPRSGGSSSAAIWSWTGRSSPSPPEESRWCSPPGSLRSWPC